MEQSDLIKISNEAIVSKICNVLELINFLFSISDINALLPRC